MSFFEYIKDKIMIILLNISCLLALSIYLLLTGNNFDSVLLIGIVWILILSTYFFNEFSRRNRYFRKLNNILNNLEKRYLLAEVMKPTFRLEDKIYREIIRKSNKSVIEKINQLEDEQKDYKEYIESWIHEVKIPITSMDLICNNNKNDVMRKMSSELRRVESYVEMALFYARSEEVYKDYFIKEISLKKVVLETISKNKPYLIGNSMSISIDLDDSTIFSDEKWLSFIINQVLINAVKYKSSETGSINIFSEKIKNGVSLIIEDNGIGIKESEIGRIFDKGFTGTNGRNIAQSTGIGLYLCKKLCNKLGLEIKAESKENEYTKIIIIFPKANYLSKL
ncbi:sensor histidine kinase [Clostridium sp. MSJ-4]|uniref:histidine kinase n=1 Tax=Clostridium simiarum TaxID=2841506 RepID=A0ABS6EZH0_9CLOT|nr:sensor histidine kinase [Clostridium simiarum]MBU5591621.1 sensor histidine kinase [Clostridium simiarum]